MYSSSNETGIYIIRCQINNFIYIGSASGIKGFRKRATYHRWTLNHGKHHSPTLQNHFNKYGIDAFTFEIALICPSEKCLDFEQAFLDANGIGYHNKSYNTNPSGICLYPGKRNGMSKLKGRKASEETRRRISEALTGIKRSEETKLKVGNASRGRKHSPESLARMSAKLKGRKRSPEYSEKMRQWNLDNPLSPEARKKIAQTAIEANSKEYIITKPDGEEIHVKNMTEFCRQNDLSRASMSYCACGAAISHRGWQCRYAHVTKEEQEITFVALKLKFGIKEYIVTSPDGTQYLTENLTHFSIEHGIDAASLSTISLGKKRHYKGWLCRLVDEPEEIRVKRLALRGKGKDYVITTPQGEEVAVTSLTKFCSQHKLDQSSMTRVARGKRKHYKGYLCRYA